MKIRISALDAKFSKFIRERDGWTCQRCFKKYEPPTNALHCSHFWGRANKSVRFDPENCVALCHGDHVYFTANPKEHCDWFLKRLGQKRFDALQVRKNIKRFDPALIAIWLKHNGKN